MDPNFWNDVYQSKKETEVSWYQPVPAKSLQLIDEFDLQPNDPIIDIGGGDSHLVDELLRKGFSNISILDISSVALERAKSRLSEKANSLKFLTADVTKFIPPESYRLWHDRATFHFLTSKEDIETYLNIANQSIVSGGFLIVSTFSKTGPDKCSGLNISQYSDSDLKALFKRHFTNIRCFGDTHTTPWGAGQDFVYCGFKKS